MDIKVTKILVNKSDYILKRNEKYVLFKSHPSLGMGGRQSYLTVLVASWQLEFSRFKKSAWPDLYIYFWPRNKLNQLLTPSGRINTQLSLAKASTACCPLHPPSASQGGQSTYIWFFLTPWMFISAKDKSEQQFSNTVRCHLFVHHLDKGWWANTIWLFIFKFKEKQEKKSFAELWMYRF